MNNENFKSAFKKCLLIIDCSILIIALFFITYTGREENNYVVNESKTNNNAISTIPNVFDETAESTSFYQIPINLQELTIKENEGYKINDFIIDYSSLPKDLNYNYTLPEMNNYKLPGTYKIKIAFYDDINRVEKETNLTILKVEVPKVTVAPKEKKVKVEEKKLSVEERILKDNKKIGDSGRLYFDSLYSIALYQPFTTEEAQRYVDNEDSGSIIKYPNIDFIADHANQGFDIIKRQNVGDYVYIKDIDKNGNVIINKYQVKVKTTGYNTRYELLTKDGTDVRNTNYPIALYTCNSADGYHITILLLSKAN